jgi:hypothetical protein
VPEEAATAPTPKSDVCFNLTQAGNQAALYSATGNGLSYSGKPLCPWEAHDDFMPNTRIPDTRTYVTCEKCGTAADPCTVLFGAQYACQPVVYSMFVIKREEIVTGNTVTYTDWTTSHDDVTVAYACGKKA